MRRDGGVRARDMGHDVAGVEFDLELVPRLARFHAAPIQVTRTD